MWDHLKYWISSWLFITKLNDLFAQFIKNLEKGDKTQQFKLIGWWSLELDLQMLESQIKDFKITMNHLRVRCFKILTY